MIAGALLMIGAGTTFVLKDVVFGYAPVASTRRTCFPAADGRHASVSGAKNILLIGIDPRPNQDPTEAIRSDSILILHIPASHDIGLPDLDPAGHLGRRSRSSDNGKRTLRAAATTRSTARSPRAATGSPARTSASTAPRCWPTPSSRTGASPSTRPRSSTSSASRTSSRCSAASTCTSTSATVSVHIGHDAKGNTKVPFDQRDDAQRRHHPDPDQGRDPEGVSRSATSTWRPGRRWTSSASARPCPTATTTGSATSSSSSRPCSRRSPARTCSSNPGTLNKVLEVIGRAMTIDTGGIGLDDWIFAMRGIGGDDLLTSRPTTAASTRRRRTPAPRRSTRRPWTC